MRLLLLFFILVCAAPAKADAPAPLSPFASTPDWGFELSGSSKAWKRSEGDRRIVVAVIDTGVDLTHPALAGNLWTNPGESGRDSSGRDKRTNGVDDDRNGYVDDVHGWNFVAADNDVADNHGHGTHVAGIIGGQSSQLKGMAKDVSLMILKYYDPKARGFSALRTTLAAIRYAIRMKVDVINYSGGGRLMSIDEREAIREAGSQGIVVVAAAGNEASDSDLAPYYPANYGLENVVSVTAIDESLNLLPTSNWGRTSVDVAAPGKDIVSALPGGLYGMMTGTSQATAFVTGALALLKAAEPELTEPRDLIRRLVDSSWCETTLNGKTRMGSRLAADRLLLMRERGHLASGLSQKNAPGASGQDTQIQVSNSLDAKRFQKRVRGLAALASDLSRGFAKLESQSANASPPQLSKR